MRDKIRARLLLPLLHYGGEGRGEEVSPSKIKCVCPDNNIGFRCVLVSASSRKAEQLGAIHGGTGLPCRSQETSLTAAPAPAGKTGKDAVAAVPGKTV
jgi:hypothetical protein